MLPAVALQFHIQWVASLQLHECACTVQFCLRRNMIACTTENPLGAHHASIDGDVDSPHYGLQGH